MAEGAVGECGIVTVERQSTAVTKTKVRMDGIPDAQRSLRARLAKVVPTLGAEPLGHAATLWHMPVDGMLAMEIGLVVSRDFVGVDGVEPAELPAGRAAHVRLVGPYDGLPGAWGTLFGWCKAQNLALADVNWEIYGDDPERPETSLYTLLA